VPLSLQVEGIDQSQLLDLALERPGEVLRLAVEKLPVVLTDVRAEEAVGAVRGAHGAHPTECGHE